MRAFGTSLTLQEEFDFYKGAGYSGSLNDMMFAYLGDQGLTGALPDRLGTGYSGSPSDIVFSYLDLTGTLPLSLGTGWFDLTRSTAATYPAASGLLDTAAVDVARIEHDSGGTPLGLLVEGAATNSVLHSEDFSQSEWGKLHSGSSAAAPTVAAGIYPAPDGSMTANRVVFDAVSASGHGSLEQALALPAGTYTMSVWLRLDDSAADVIARIRMDCTGKAVATNVVVTNQWKRFTLTISDVPDLKAVAAVRLRPSLGTAASATFHIWGAQVEEGGAATSYIVTDNSAASRAADIPEITGVSGTYDVVATDAYGNTQSYPSEVVSDGYWPLNLNTPIQTIVLTPIE